MKMLHERHVAHVFWVIWDVELGGDINFQASSEGRSRSDRICQISTFSHEKISRPVYSTRLQNRHSCLRTNIINAKNCNSKESRHQVYLVLFPGKCMFV